MGFSLPDWHYDAIEALNKNDEHKFKAIKLTFGPCGYGHGTTRKRNPMARRGRVRGIVRAVRRRAGKTRRRARRNFFVGRYTGASTRLGIWNPRRRRKSKRRNARISRGGLRALRRIVRSHSRRKNSRRGFSAKRSRAAKLGWRRRRSRTGARGGRRITRR